ncbi:MAG: ParB/RepB/Spo0J family partition protein [Bacilli bacterium]|nr:ParB/RepB/Spo0J family partition protein [Bacilli bacterium]
MEQKRRALGKGLEQLFNNESLDFSKVEERIIESTDKNEIVQINLDELRSNPYQPRIYFDEAALEELAASIKEHGVFQPIIVKKSIKGYDIIAGERRVKASIKAGLKTIPAIIKDFTDEEMMQIALLENLQREDLSSIEEAKAYRDIINALNITQDELAKRVGKSRSHITNMLGLLRLPLEVKKMINSKKISMGHARVLSKLENKEQIEVLANKVINEDLSVRQLEDLTNSNDKYTKASPVSTLKKKTNRPYVYVEDILKDKLGTKVKITDKKMEISFDSAKDLDRILEILNIKVD